MKNIFINFHTHIKFSFFPNKKRTIKKLVLLNYNGFLVHKMIQNSLALKRLVVSWDGRWRSYITPIFCKCVYFHTIYRKIQQNIHYLQRISLVNHRWRLNCIQKLNWYLRRCFTFETNWYLYQFIKLWFFVGKKRDKFIW